MKSEFVIKFWERIGYIYMMMNTVLWTPIFGSFLILNLFYSSQEWRKKSSFIDGNDDGLLTSGTN